jgi:hypothetical protein
MAMDQRTRILVWVAVAGVFASPGHAGAQELTPVPPAPAETSRALVTPDAERATAELVRAEKWDTLRERYLDGRTHAKSLAKDKDLAVALQEAPNSPGLRQFLLDVSQRGSIYLVRALAAEAFANDPTAERAPAMVAFARRNDMTTVWSLTRGPLAKIVSPRMTTVLAAVRAGARASNTLASIDQDLARLVFSKPNFGTLASAAIHDALSSPANHEIHKVYLKEVFPLPHAAIWEPQLAYLLTRVTYDKWMDDAAAVLRKAHWQGPRFDYLRAMTKIPARLDREDFLARLEKKWEAARAGQPLEWESSAACGTTAYRLTQPSPRGPGR